MFVLFGLCLRVTEVKLSPERVAALDKDQRDNLEIENVSRKSPMVQSSKVTNSCGVMNGRLDY